MCNNRFVHTLLFFHSFDIYFSSALITETQAARQTTNNSNECKENGPNNIAAQTFTFRELATATKNFRSECLVGEGGFGRVYKGQLSTGQV